ncbi:MAG: TonB C-terminal domain-containing protein [Acidobacteriota bacterium]
MDAVSEILIGRAEKGDGLNSMLGASVMAHVALVAIFILAPVWWFGADNKPPETVMQISLGGPVGPDKSGLTSMTSRTIQQVNTELKKPVEQVQPPASKTPEMIDPTKAPPRKTEPNKVDAKDPRSNRPTKGEEIRQGSSIAQTTARGQGFGGLSSGGGGNGVQLEVTNFCCPEYLATMSALIKANWNGQQNAAGLTRMRFVIQRNGRISDVTVLDSSGVQILDFYAERALKLTTLPPLPAAYPDGALAVRLAFEYTR